MRLPITIDFETEAIQSRPAYPPKPVGVAIKYPGKKGKYLHWGHHDSVGKGRSDFGAVKQELADIWGSGSDLLFHNSKFDLDVAEVFFGLKLPNWDRVHDTLFLLFLYNPHARSLSLKESAEELLGLAPDERDAVGDWLREHGIIGANERPGAHICKAPASIVGPYAIGDVDRTLKLFQHLLPKMDKKMLGAYNRERQLMPILLRNEQEGMPVDVEGLAKAVPIYQKALGRADHWLRKRLGSPELNFDADRDVGEALFTSKVVTDWVYTKGSANRAPQRSVAKDNLTVDRFNDKAVHATLDYRNRLQTVLSMSMIPWLAQASSDGRIYTEWNQVRQNHGKEMGGTRTGRLSCSRFMNISKKFKGHKHPKHIKLLPELPLVRKFILPEKGHLWVHKDWRQQEFKIAAHYEDGPLKAAYLDNPELDQHDAMLERLHGMGHKHLDRDVAKMGNLAILYALGAAAFAAKLRMPMEDAMAIRAATKAAMPGLIALENECKRRGRSNEPVRTWGGRLYYCEPPAIAKKGARKGQEVTFEYKLLNYLIQGSAADCTKEALIRYDATRKDSKLLVTVHDEINISVPVKAQKRESENLRKVMEGIEFDVLMLTDGKSGASWGDLKDDK